MLFPYICKLARINGNGGVSYLFDRTTPPLPFPPNNPLEYVTYKGFDVNQNFSTILLRSRTADPVYFSFDRDYSNLITVNQTNYSNGDDGIGFMRGNEQVYLDFPNLTRIRIWKQGTGNDIVEIHLWRGNTIFNEV